MTDEGINTAGANEIVECQIQPKQNANEEEMSRMLADVTKEQLEQQKDAKTDIRK